MRIVYMGTPEFASEPLERLYGEGHDIVGVFTQPDKPRNRGMKVTYSPVKELALKRGIDVYQPASLRDGEVLNLLRNLKPELIAVVAYGKLLPLEILNLPPMGCINIHGSLLPKYRGAAPIQWAVLNGETETGVTSMYMAEELDAGDMILSEKTAVGSEETAGELYIRLSTLGAKLLCETVSLISRGEAVRTPQDTRLATFAPPLGKDLSPIDWSKSAFEINCKIRGLNPWPVATAEFQNIRYKIHSARIGEKKRAVQPGEIVSAGNGGLEVACGDGTIIITELQAPGGKRMAAADYLRGHPICP